MTEVAILGKRGRPPKGANEEFKSLSREAKSRKGGGPVVKQEWVPPSVALSLRDKAVQLCLDDDQLGCTGAEGGYRMARATHGVHNGSYFWEAEILAPVRDAKNTHIRLGWSTRLAELQAPVGYDKHSFAYRDLAGSKVHNSMRADGYGQPYGPGDIVGCYLFLDVSDSSRNQMRFFKNGVDQGVAFRGSEIPSGVYFPAVSLYRPARVRCNFGPSFIMRHDIYGANAVSEVSPMSPEDRKVHESKILEIRALHGIGSSGSGSSSSSSKSSSSSSSSGTSSTSSGLQG